jgi:hypothetical protein
MRRHWKRIALLLAVTAVAACVLIAFSSPEPEPSYQGRTLSEWISPANYPQPEMDALLHMGTNVLPHLVKWVGYTTPEWRKLLLRFNNKHPNMLPQAFTQWIYRPGYRVSHATEALDLMRTNAYPALLMLAELGAKTKDRTALDNITQCMYVILRPPPTTEGPHNVIEEAFLSPDPMIRQAATNAQRLGRQLRR